MEQLKTEMNWLHEMMDTPAAPSPALALLPCGHEGRQGEALCFICASNQGHADAQAAAQIAQRYGTLVPYVVPSNSFAAWGYRKTGRIELARITGIRGGKWSVFSAKTKKQRKE